MKRLPFLFQEDAHWRATINLHLMGLEAMGAKIELHHGYIEAKADVLKGANISLIPSPSQDRESDDGCYAR